MKFLCDSGVEVLQFDNGVDVLQLENLRSFDSYDEFACLPLCVLEARSLIKLKLSWYFRIDQAFLNHPIKFSSLKVLSLSQVYLGDGQVINNIISKVPSTFQFPYSLVSVMIHLLSLTNLNCKTTQWVHPPSNTWAYMQIQTQKSLACFLSLAYSGVAALRLFLLVWMPTRH